VRRPAAALAVAVALIAGCGVDTQSEPDVLRSPPAPPTATPTATQEATGSPTPSPAGSD
jgi:hypothetical protein